MHSGGGSQGEARPGGFLTQQSDNQAILQEVTEEAEEMALSVSSVLSYKKS
jgi:hypothetical protein